MFGIIANFTTNLFRTYLNKRFMKAFFPEGTEHKQAEHAVYFAFFTATLLIHTLFRYPPANIATNILFLYFITLIYEGSRKKKLLVTFLVYGISMFCDCLAIFSFYNYFSTGKYGDILAYVSVFLTGISEFIIERYLMKNKGSAFTLPCWKMLLCIPVISVCILLPLTVLNLNNEFAVAIISAGLLFINMLTFYLYDTLITAYQKQEETFLLERQADSYANQLEILMQSEAKLKGLRHDLKHHFIELLNMADTQHEEEMTAYIHAMQEELSNPSEYVESGNKEIDSLLNLMIRKANEVLNDVEHKISVPDKLAISAYDLNVIIGNLLDNAIHAASESERKWLSVSAVYEKELLFIRVQNSFSGSLTVKNGIYLSTKPEKRGHGIGLQNVRRVVEKNKGNIQITHTADVFDVKIMLYMHGYEQSP